MREEILIVEDDTSLAEPITLHLNDQGYATEHVADGQRGLGAGTRRITPVIVRVTITQN